MQNSAFDKKYIPSRSIKWSLSAIVLMVFGIVNAIVYYFYSGSLFSGYAAEREKVFSYKKESFKYFMDEYVQELSRYIELTSSFIGENLTKNTNNDDLKIIIEPYWSRLSADMDIESMIITNQNNNIIFATKNSNLLRNVYIERYGNIDNINNSSYFVQCSESCRQVIVIPILHQGKVVSTIVLSAALSHVLYDYSRFSGGDIGLIKEVAADNANTATAIIDVLTRRERVEGIVINALNQYSANHLVDLNTTIQDGDKYYDVRLLPFSTEGINENGYIVFVDDVTLLMTGIKHDVIQNSLINVIGMLLAALLLYFILKRPVGRLTAIAEALPMLAMAKIPNTNIFHSTKENPEGSVNEIDLLEISMNDLSNRLMTLNREVEEKVLDLTKERDFNRLLLEAAQVAIITQSSRGDFILANDYAKRHLGIGETENEIKCLSDLFVNDGLSGEYTNKIQRVFKGEIKNLWHEAEVKVFDGTIRTIVWVHTHLDATRGNIPGSLSVGIDVTERKQAESRLSWLADHDPLTGLFNRRKFHEEFSRAISQAKRYQHSVSLLFFDLDKFKNINDTKGHHAGDQVIKAVASALKEEVRSCDLVARLGGDEFAVVLPEVGIEGAMQVGKKITRKISSIQIPEVTDHHYLSTSIGVAVYPDHGEHTSDLVSNADIAMYQAKSKGKGLVHVFSGAEQVKERIENEMYWENRITRALRKKHFILHYQPILDIGKNRINHYEVLLRMKSNHGVLFSPGGFISIAEKTSHIREIDHWVLDTAIRSLDAFRINGHDVSFSINLSAHAFSDEVLLPHLETLLGSISTPAHNIIFEITETAALEDFSAACDMMYKIRSLGCRFALDDFGVGFSSFSYIRDLPVDYIKIDGTFIRELANSRDDQILVQALATIADGYGKKTIAEYVEDQETLNLLREYHVDMAQGFHIGKPQEQLVGEVMKLPASMEGVH